MVLQKLAEVFVCATPNSFSLQTDENGLAGMRRKESVACFQNWSEVFRPGQTDGESTVHKVHVLLAQIKSVHGLRADIKKAYSILKLGFNVHRLAFHGG